MIRRLPAAVLGLTLGASVLAPVGAVAQNAPVPPAARAQASVQAPGSVHARRSLPSQSVWLRDTRRVLKGANHYLNVRAAKADPDTLAIVLDIDNTSLQSHYAWPKAVPATLRVARKATDLGIHVFFVTGRLRNGLWAVKPELTDAGYTYDRVFGRRPGQDLVAEKSAHRRKITKRFGFTIVADIGNRWTDHAGPFTGRSYKLPDYGGLLD